MCEVDFKSLREKLSVEQIKDIIGKYGVQPAKETEQYLIYPTICHNLSGGSNKLYYYKDSHLFKCYTHCEGLFDIFELLQKIHKLRGEDITVFAAILECGLSTDTSDILTDDESSEIESSIEYLYNLLNTKHKKIKLPTLDESLLNRFIFDMRALKVWKLENISYNSMLRYRISYDPVNNCIIIPNFNINNELISVRGRYFDGDIKYKPITFGDAVLSHPSSMSLYGLNITKNAIQKQKKVVIFEGEKSVLKMDTIYGKNNISVATLGKNISNQQIMLLKQLGVNEVIIGYDADYRNYYEMAAKRKEYKRIGTPLKTYFNVSLLIDMELNQLGYKDSPIDKGQEVFENLLKNRLYI